VGISTEWRGAATVRQLQCAGVGCGDGDANAHTNQYTDAHANHYTNANEHGDADTYADRDEHGNTNAHADEHEHADAYFNKYKHADEHTNADAHANGDEYSNANAHSHHHTNTDENAHHACSHQYTSMDPNPNPYTDLDTWLANGHADTHTHTHTHTNPNAHLSCNTYRDYPALSFAQFPHQQHRHTTTQTNQPTDVCAQALVNQTANNPAQAARNTYGTLERHTLAHDPCDVSIPRTDSNAYAACCYRALAWKFASAYTQSSCQRHFVQIICQLGCYLCRSVGQ
jgi:hypothetical protein